jgi:hypothetical protein
MSEATDPAQPRLSFSIRTVLEVFAVAAVILALIYTRAPAPTGDGRYQLVAVPSDIPQLPNLFVIDTQTGKVWKSGRVDQNGMSWYVTRQPPTP